MEAFDHPQTIGHLLLQRAVQMHTAPACGKIEENRVKVLNFGEYFQKVETLVRGLYRNGIRKGDSIAIYGPTCLDWHLLDLALLCLGAKVIPIYPNIPPKDIQYILEHSESKALFFSSQEKIQHLLNHLKDETPPKLKLLLLFTEQDPHLVLPHEIELISIKKIQRSGVSKEMDSLNYLEEKIKKVDPTEIATIIYTSGTTGRPKGAVITHGQLFQLLFNISSNFKNQIGEGDRFLIFLPLSHVLGRCDSFIPIALGSEAIYAENIDKLMDNLHISQPNIIIGVPRIFEKVYQKIQHGLEKAPPHRKELFNWALNASKTYYDKIDKDQSPTPWEVLQKNLAYKLVFSKIYQTFGGKIKFLVSGGAPLSPEIINFMRFANLVILEGYGLTETMGPAFINPLVRPVPGTVGIPIGDFQVDFTSEGEILLKSRAIFREYFKNPKETESVFSNDWFHTGDLGELTSDGYLKITGRIKDIIITSGGKNVAPQKIENLMKDTPYISHFMVVGEGRKYLTGVVGIERDSFSSLTSKLQLSTSCPISEIVQHPEVRRLINESVQKVNKSLGKFEQIKYIYIAPHEFTVDSGHLTPSLKLKKKFLNEEYKEQIDALYNNN